MPSNVIHIMSIVDDMPTLLDIQKVITVEREPEGNKPKVLANKSKILVSDSRQYVDFTGPVLSEADRESNITMPVYICSFERKGKYSWFLSKKSCCMGFDGTVYSQDYVKRQVCNNDYTTFVRYNPHGLAWMAGIQYEDEPIIRVSEHEFFNITVPYPVWVEGKQGQGRAFWGLLSNGKIFCFADDFSKIEDGDDLECSHLSLDAMELDLEYLLSSGYTVFYDKYYTNREKVVRVDIDVEQEKMIPSENMISW